MVVHQSALTGAPVTANLSRRDEMILEHLPQVRLIAKQLNDRLPISVGIDDLISAGVLGLISAVDHFDPAQQVRLKTYAEYKIRGAILDSLRSLDWAPRLQRRRSRLIEKAVFTLEQRLGRVPLQEDVAEELGITVEAYQSWISAARNLSVGSLEALHAEEDGHTLFRYLADRTEESPAQTMEQIELKERLAAAIERLPQIEKTILGLYYFEEMTLKETAQIVGLHESRISQLKTQSIQHLRSALRQ